jgi:hypothetical protein
MRETVGDKKTAELTASWAEHTIGGKLSSRDGKAPHETNVFLADWVE